MRRVVSSRILNFLFFALFVLLFFSIGPNFREDDWGAIRKVIHPEYYSTGEFFHIDLTKYNPYYNHYYLSGFVIKLLNCEENFAVAGKLFWLLEHGIIAILFLVLANHLFRRDQFITILTFLWVIFNSPTPWAEPKFAAAIFMMLAILFYLKEKFFASAFFGAAMFYFHIGFATWWLLTFFFALAWLWLKDRKISFKQCAQYASALIIFASPILWVYFQRLTDSKVDPFTNLYAYYAIGYQASPLLAFQEAPGFIVNRILSVILVLFGVEKAVAVGFTSQKIRPIAWGVITLIFVQFIFGDLLGIMAVSKTQLVRAPVITDVLWPIFVSFLVVFQARQKRYFGLVFALLIMWGYNLVPSILGFDIYAAQNIFFVLLILNEIFEVKIYAWLNKTNIRIPRSVDRFAQRAFNPVIILLLAVGVMAIKLPVVKPVIKAVLKRPDNPEKVRQVKVKEAFLDTFRYFDENVPYDGKALLSYQR